MERLKGYTTLPFHSTLRVLHLQVESAISINSPELWMLAISTALVFSFMLHHATINADIKKSASQNGHERKHCIGYPLPVLMQGRKNK